MEHNTSRAEAERLLGIAEKQLHLRDLNGSRDFAILAQETEPLLDGSDQILAIVDVLLAAEKRINNHPDWYAILQLDRRLDDPEIIKKQYRRLALLLHPDKNKFAYSDSAFKLVADAWAVLSDTSKKSLYDHEFTLFSKIDLVAMKKQKEFQQQNQKLPVRRNAWEGNPNTSGGGATQNETPSRLTSFWTTCPYCYNLYQYPRIYEGCCLRCQNCERAFQAVVLPSLPPLVSGKDAYYCCWGFFPMGFAEANSESAKKSGFPNWVPPVVPNPEPVVNPMPIPVPEAAAVAPNGGAPVGDVYAFVDVPRTRVSAAPVSGSGQTQKKRGRPRKNPMV